VTSNATNEFKNVLLLVIYFYQFSHAIGSVLGPVRRPWLVKPSAIQAFKRSSVQAFKRSSVQAFKRSSHSNCPSCLASQTIHSPQKVRAFDSIPQSSMIIR
jgi:hypothetical protein